MQVSDEELERLCGVFQQAAMTVKVNRGMDPHQRTRVGLRAVLAEITGPGN